MTSDVTGGCYRASGTERGARGGKRTGAKEQPAAYRGAAASST